MNVAPNKRINSPSMFFFGSSYQAYFNVELRKL